MSVSRPKTTVRDEESQRDKSSWALCLPSYSRSLLKIQVPVTVTLATAKKHVRDLVELVPGSILQFEKMCDETLTLEVGNQTVAEGETVKVGDKFGLRITSIVMPGERFQNVAPSDPRPAGSSED